MERFEGCLRKIEEEKSKKAEKKVQKAAEPMTQEQFDNAIKRLKLRKGKLVIEEA